MPLWLKLLNVTLSACGVGMTGWIIAFMGYRVIMELMP